MKKVATLLICSLLISVTGCAVTGPSSSSLLPGRWQSEVGGFPIEVTYAETSVQVGSREPVAYLLEGDRLSFADGGNQVRVLSFPSNDEMLQQDPLTGTTQVFTRVSE